MPAMLVLLLAAAGAQARSRMNTFWYRLTVRVDQDSLPRSVTVEVKPSDFGDLIELRWINRSRTPIVLTRKLRAPLAWIGVLARNELPMFKLVAGGASEWTNEGWKKQGTGLTTEELYAACRLRPFDVEFRQRPLPRGRQTITRSVRIPYYAAGKQHALSGKVKFDVDHDSKALLATRDILDPIPTPDQLVYRNGVLTNPGSSPVYFAARFKDRVDWVGKMLAGQVPCYRLQRGQVAYTLTPAHPSSRNRRAVSHGWYHDRTMRSLELPLTWFARRAGVALHLQSEYRRPKTVPVPAAQTLDIPVRFGDREHVVRVAVSYAVNPAFKG